MLARHRTGAMRFVSIAHKHQNRTINAKSIPTWIDPRR